MYLHVSGCVWSTVPPAGLPAADLQLHVVAAGRQDQVITCLRSRPQRAARSCGGLAGPTSAAASLPPHRPTASATTAHRRRPPSTAPPAPPHRPPSSTARRPPSTALRFNSSVAADSETGQTRARRNKEIINGLSGAPRLCAGLPWGPGDEDARTSSEQGG